MQYIPKQHFFVWNTFVVKPVEYSVFPPNQDYYVMAVFLKAEVYWIAKTLSNAKHSTIT